MTFRVASAYLAAFGLALAGAIGGYALADAAKPDARKDAPAAAPEFKLPPGWTEEDMKACMMAGTPGEQHKALAWNAGTWEGKNTMWMMPDSPPVNSDVKSTVTSIMDGRYLKIDMHGDLPGMGPYTGFGLLGYDNVAGRYVATWIDNHSTTIMNGVGAMSKDGKVMTIEYAYTCPVTKKPGTMREVDTITGPNTKTFEMFGTEPKSGKEYRMMKVEWTKK